MDEVEVPEYFLCPISLQIMKDPVTAITGITYERESIEHWLRTSKENPTCPVTKQSLSKDSDLTPNHTLRRLIKSWIATTWPSAINQIPSPKPLVDKVLTKKLINDIDVSHLCVGSLKKIETLLVENERNKVYMVEAGLAKALVCLVIRCWEERRTIGLEDALRILHLVWDASLEEINKSIKENIMLVDSLTWVLSSKTNGHDYSILKTKALSLLNKTLKVIAPNSMEKLSIDFFKTILNVLKERISTQATKSALLVLIEACPWGRNKNKIVEANAVFELIELELDKATPERNITELIFELLAQLCLVADGRDQFLKHAASLAMLTKRILRVSPAIDDRAVNIVGLISRYSASNEVVMEMLRVGAVTKLCMVMQANCDVYLKDKAKGILKLHSNVWNNNSPCIAVYLMTRYPR